MTKATATVLVIAVLALVGIGALALTPAGRNLATGDAYPGVPNTGSNNVSNRTYNTSTPLPPRNDTNIFNTFYSTTTYRMTPVPTPARHAVTYTANAGFTPRIAVIAKGDTVIFYNNSTSTIRVAGLPGFDALATISPGASWSQEFDRLGTYGYSNYFDSDEAGTIVVQ